MTSILIFIVVIFAIFGMYKLYISVKNIEHPDTFDGNLDNTPEPTESPNKDKKQM